MSRLYCTERGRSLVSHNEEITRWRWAKKQLKLPAAAAGAKADLWLYTSMYTGNQQPLDVEVNAQKLSPLPPVEELAGGWKWRSVSVPEGLLREGLNEIILTNDSPTMNAWILGLENDYRNPASFLSTDRGQTWRNHAMGAHGMLRGEYMVRLRSHAADLRELRAPKIVYEDSTHPRVQELAAFLPANIREIKDPWEQLLALRTWVATRWEHDPFGRSYSPWDPWTILDWVKRDTCHGRQGRVAFCVHFGVVFATCAAALGHRARCFAITSDINGWEGHFMAEAYDERLGKWVVHDANYDAHYEDGVPLSAIELADRAHRGESLESLVRTGPGMPKGPERVLNGFKLFISGRPFRNVGIWARNNLVSDATASPPNHGSMAYCETDFVWYNPDGMDLAPMFPYRTGQRRYFKEAPK